jgi:uncharacterized protein (DUF1800 family)
MIGIAENIMSADRKREAALALHRFGFGPARDSIAVMESDPRGAVLADLQRPRAGRIATANLPSSGEITRTLFEFRAERKAQQKLAQRAKKEAEANGAAASMSDGGNAAVSAAGAPSPRPPDKQPPLPQQLLQNEAAARIDAAFNAELGFVERLVWFWSNHFCVSADKVFAAAGAYEREAIRPHVLGRFVDMLAAVESHPAMLFYLDNVESIGPDSVAGINRDKGLNENLAREILELHTLGVHGGYSQQDVTSFANVLTGRTWIAPSEPLHGGEFVFNKRLHEPGEQVVLGKRYSGDGVEQGCEVLADLARHPATAQHIAYKLACHFVADDPPPRLVANLAKTFKGSDGDLKAVAEALVEAEESWTTQRTKLKRPAEWIVGILRLTAGEGSIPIGRFLNAQASLGEALWRPPAPNGYADTEAAWIDGVPRRLDVANELAGPLAAGTDPLDLLDRGLGPLASAETRSTIARAESRAQALALLVMTPEFLRR